MKTKGTALLFGIITMALFVPAADAAKLSKKSNSPSKQSSPATAGQQEHLGTDFKFDGMTVHGQYQSANEGLVTVEGDKELSNLLDYRTDYKDRLKNSRLNP